MKTRRREYSSPEPPPPKKQKLNTPKPPPKPKRKPPAKGKGQKVQKADEDGLEIPLEVLEPMLMYAIERGDEDVANILYQSGSGQVGRNRRFAECSRLNKLLQKYLETLKWKRIIIRHSTVLIGPQIEYFEGIVQKLRARNIKRHVDTIRVSLEGYSAENHRLLEIITDIFARATKKNIQEVTLSLNLKSSPVAQFHRIDGFMSIIPSFKNLTVFAFVACDSPYVSESCLAFIIKSLPKLQAVTLHGCFGLQDLIPYDAQLGPAIASRRELDSLNIRNLRSFGNDWLELEWWPELKELTIELDPMSLSFDRTHLLVFCDLFRDTLVNLYLDRGYTHFPRTPVEMEWYTNLSIDFINLRYLTYRGHPSALFCFSRAPNLKSLTWSVSATDAPLAGLDEFRTLHPPNGERWVELREVNVPKQLIERPAGVQVPQQIVQFRQFLQQRGIALNGIAFEEYFEPSRGFSNRDSQYYPRPSRLPVDLELIEPEPAQPGPAGPEPAPEA